MENYSHPYYLSNIALKIDYEIDLAAEKLLIAEKANHKIAVEIKSFLKTSFVHEFHSVFGQYLVYQESLWRIEPDRELFLAIPSTVATRLEKHPFLQQLISQYRIKIMVFNSENNTITIWKA